MPGYAYEVFLSYKRADREWAHRLHDTLTATHIPTFQDIEDLTAGAGWLEQVRTFVPTCRHLLLLWSAKVEPEIDDIIAEEINSFRNGNSEYGRGRKMITVSVDGTIPSRAIFTTLHAHSVPELIRRTPEGALDVTSSEWTRVTDKIIRDVRESEARKHVNLLVLATSADWWGDMNNLRYQIAHEQPVQDLLSRLELTDAQQPNVFDGFLQRYVRGARGRPEWRPFGQAGPTVREIVNQLEARLNEWARSQRQKEYSFEDVSPSIWDSPEKSDPVIRTLSQELSLIIVDPLSLHDGRVRNLAERLAPCYESPKCVVVTLGPKGWADTTPEAIREQLSNLSRQVYSYFYNPRYPPPLGAHSATHATDLDAINRLMWRAIAADAGTRRRPAPILKNT